MLYYPGKVGVHKLPDESRFAPLREKAAQDYARAPKFADLPAPNGENSIVLSIEHNGYHLANSRAMRPVAQTARLPHDMFLATTAPHLTHLDRKVTTLITPIDYLSQDLTRDATMRLYQTQANHYAAPLMGDQGFETGHVYDAKLIEAIGVDSIGRRQGISLKNLFARAADGRIGAEVIKGAGWLSGDDMRHDVMQWAKYRWGEDFMEERVILSLLKPVNARNWSYTGGPHMPFAACSRDGKTPTLHEIQGLPAPQIT